MVFNYNHLFIERYLKKGYVIRCISNGISSSLNNRMEGKVLGSRHTRCICNFPLKIYEEGFQKNLDLVVSQMQLYAYSDAFCISHNLIF